MRPLPKRFNQILFKKLGYISIPFSFSSDKNLGSIILGGFVDSSGSVFMDCDETVPFMEIFGVRSST